MGEQDGAKMLVIPMLCGTWLLWQLFFWKMYREIHKLNLGIVFPRNNAGKQVIYRSNGFFQLLQSDIIAQVEATVCMCT